MNKKNIKNFVSYFKNIFKFDVATVKNYT